MKREEEGELQALHSLATEQVPSTTRRKLNMEVLEKKIRAPHALTPGRR
jgi:hypothetical protein